MWYNCAGTNIYLSSLLSDAPRTELESAIHSISNHLPTVSIPNNTSHRHKIEETEEHLQDDLECRLSIGSQDKTRLSSSRESFPKQGQSPLSALDGSSSWRDSSNDLMAGQVLHLEELSCNTGSGSFIVDRFCLELKKGASLVLQGKSGVGKSTLLKALQGLWPCTYSKLSRCQEVFFHRKYTTHSVNTHTCQFSWPECLLPEVIAFDLWFLSTLRKSVASVYPSDFCVVKLAETLTSIAGTVQSHRSAIVQSIIFATPPVQKSTFDHCFVQMSAVK